MRMDATTGWLTQEGRCLAIEPDGDQWRLASVLCDATDGSQKWVFEKTASFGTIKITNRRSSMLIRLFLLACVLAACQALYFHIAETEKKCFIEEIPDETMVNLFCLQLL
ncbi:unnamed protein product [Strongylus vulgaris]|uniref:Uncharacterized protein n=1 Tax=Strongylus vulgaris TaxID=40348 RepID=A0A3P7M2K5_STRVU|nr:unnamed protein product [Strongylus vulgaris]